MKVFVAECASAGAEDGAEIRHTVGAARRVRCQRVRHRVGEGDRVDHGVDADQPRAADIGVELCPAPCVGAPWRSWKDADDLDDLVAGGYLLVEQAAAGSALKTTGRRAHQPLLAAVLRRLGDVAPARTG